VTVTSQPETDWILQKDAAWLKKNRKSSSTGRKNIQNPGNGWKWAEKNHRKPSE